MGHKMLINHKSQRTFCTKKNVKKLKKLELLINILRADFAQTFTIS